MTTIDETEAPIEEAGRPARRRRLWHAKVALLATVLGAGVVAGIAGAESSVSFTDPSGDACSGVDITRVEIESYPEGSLSFWVTVNGFFACSSDGDGEPALVALDLDQNPDTGSAFYGTEVALAPAGPVGDAHLLRADGWNFRGVRRQAGLGGGCGPTGGGYSIDRSRLGLAPGAGFNVVVAVPASHGDTAPDIRTFNYQQVPGTPPPTLGADRRAPHVSAFPSAGVHGKRARLGYWVLDGRGRTRQIVRIFRGRRVLKTIWTPLADSNPFHVSQLEWQVPGNVRGRLRFSVRALDAAGNRSKLSWATLAVR
jgi:hypothetical protein